MTVNFFLWLYTHIKENHYHLTYCWSQHFFFQQTKQNKQGTTVSNAVGTAKKKQKKEKKRKEKKKKKIVVIIFVLFCFTWIHIRKHFVVFVVVVVVVIVLVFSFSVLLLFSKKFLPYEYTLYLHCLTVKHSWKNTITTEFVWM